MSRSLFFVSPRAWASTLIALVASCALVVDTAQANVKVNCNNPIQTIGAALDANVDVSPLVLVIKGPCTENVVITRDNVTIKTNGVALATITAADSSLPAVSLDGARRIVINGVAPNGITVTGGTTGISATRGSTLDVKNCAVIGNSPNGIVSAYSSTVTVDGCSVTGNVTGVVAANTASLVITNSDVSGNTGTGIVATRSSYVRVGQDQNGTLEVQPVTVSGNGVNGIGITESSSGTVVGGTVQTSVSSNIFVGRGSSGQIGIGSNNLLGGVTIQNGLTNGVAIEGGNATIVLSTIAGNSRGIVVSNGASARIGINNGTGFAGNTISGNTGDGIGMFYGSGALIGGNTIDSNGSYGINVGQAAANLIGGNSITNNGKTGLFVRAGSALVGDSGFGAPSTINTISGNGAVGPDDGGIFAYDGGNIFVRDGIISNNIGTAVRAYHAGVIEMRGSTAVTVPATGSTWGAFISFGSLLGLRDTASIISATRDGIALSNLSEVRIVNANTVQGNGAGKVGILCSNDTPVVESTALVTGNLTNVTGTAGGTSLCNVFP